MTRQKTSRTFRKNCVWLGKEERTNSQRRFSYTAGALIVYLRFFSESMQAITMSLYKCTKNNNETLKKEISEMDE